MRPLPLEWARWRIMYTSRSPYLRPARLMAAYAGRIRPPDFLIIGTERGGTSSLYSYLLTEKSARIVGALRKEIHFFDQNYTKGWTWYLAHFPVRNDDILSGEASPHYYFFEEAAERVARVLPNASVIILLRNPIDRAYSHYQHEVELGYEKMSFEDAISREFNMSNGDWRRKNLRANGTSQYVHFSYLSKGLYVEQMKWWLERIPRERFLILKSESFFNNPGQVLSEVLQFLKLPPTDRSAFTKYNEGHYGPMGQEMRSRLKAFYEPYNRQLSELLRMDLRDWV